MDEELVVAVAVVAVVFVPVTNVTEEPADVVVPPDDDPAVTVEVVNVELETTVLPVVRVDAIDVVPVGDDVNTLDGLVVVPVNVVRAGDDVADDIGEVNGVLVNVVEADT